MDKRRTLFVRLFTYDIVSVAICSIINRCGILPFDAFTILVGLLFSYIYHKEINNY